MDSDRDDGSLEVPPGIDGDPDPLELVRAWVAHKAQHVTIRAGVWEDPFAWGMFLVDLAGHVANAYEQQEGRDRDEVLRRIKDGFEAEWGHPTDEPRGGLLG